MPHRLEFAAGWLGRAVGYELDVLVWPCECAVNPEPSVLVPVRLGRANPEMGPGSNIGYQLQGQGAAFGFDKRREIDTLPAGMVSNGNLLTSLAKYAAGAWSLLPRFQNTPYQDARTA